MITLTVIALLGILLIIVLRELRKPEQPSWRKSAPAKPAEDLGSTKITDARGGDAISIAGAGQEFRDLDFTVESRKSYQVGQREWIELRGTYSERRVLLLISVAETVDAYVVTDQDYTLADLQLSEDDLAQIDERQNPDDNFQFDGKVWHYGFSKEFVLDNRGGNFYGWVFREEGGAHTMLIRKAEGEPFTAVIGARVNPADITVYRA
ncbi:MAG TPA: hypothetical protein VN442_20210 [Bryobacteraceae bacterium]|nr:hypothetical protein [Bryobacteraceae bacterium]